MIRAIPLLIMINGILYYPITTRENTKINQSPSQVTPYSTRQTREYVLKSHASFGFGFALIVAMEKCQFFFFFVRQSIENHLILGNKVANNLAQDVYEYDFRMIRTK